MKLHLKGKRILGRRILGNCNNLYIKRNKFTTESFNAKSPEVGFCKSTTYFHGCKFV
jgi:hypothetical protein